jgi:hypothetical protein
MILYVEVNISYHKDIKIKLSGNISTKTKLNSNREGILYSIYFN